MYLLNIYNSLNEPVEIEEFGSAEDPFLSHMLSDAEDIVTRVGDAGEYRIDLHSGERQDAEGNPLSQNFTITVSLLPAVDIHEINDTLDAASTLVVGESTQAYQWRRTPNAMVGNDEDYYAIDIPSPGVLTWHLSGWIATLNWSDDYDRMYLYDENGEDVEGKTSDDPYFTHMLYPDEETLERVVTAQLSGPGTYFARFHSGAGYSTAPYSLSTDFLSIDDTYEPNNDADSAAMVEIGAEMKAWQWNSVGQTTTVTGDEDCYAVTVSSAGELTIFMTGWISTYNWSSDYDTLSLYEVSASDTNLLAAHMMGDSYTQAVALPGGGTYILKLHAGAAASTEPYTLKLDFAPENPIDTDSASDDTDTGAVGDTDTDSDTDTDTDTDTDADTDADTGVDTKLDNGGDTDTEQVDAASSGSSGCSASFGTTAVFPFVELITAVL